MAANTNGYTIEALQAQTGATVRSVDTRFNPARLQWEVYVDTSKGGRWLCCGEPEQVAAGLRAQLAGGAK